MVRAVAKRSGKMDRKLAKEIREYLLQKDHVKKVRFAKGQIHAYGQMPNSNTCGWWFAGWVRDVEIKGIDCLA
jgi:hypothetical protein